MKSRRILVVDNEMTRRDSLRALLQERSLETLAAGSAEEALQLMASGRFDLVLAETELPGKSGHYLLKQVKEQYPELQVILITHNASSYNLLQALRNGADDFIVRPIDAGEILFSALERAFQQSDRQRRTTERLEELEKDNRNLRRALKMTQALTAANERLTAAADIEDLFLEFLDLAMTELQSNRGFIALFDRASGQLGLKVSRGIAPEVCRHFSGGLPSGLVLAIAHRGKPVAIAGGLPDKLAAVATPNEMENLLTMPGLLSAPLRLRERVAGVVVISGHPQGQTWGEAELHFLVHLCRQAALVLEKLGAIHQCKRGTLPTPGAAA